MFQKLQFYKFFLMTSCNKIAVNSSRFSLYLISNSWLQEKTNYRPFNSCAFFWIPCWFLWKTCLFHSLLRDLTHWKLRVLLMHLRNSVAFLCIFQLQIHIQKSRTACHFKVMSPWYFNLVKALSERVCIHS